MSDVKETESKSTEFSPFGGHSFLKISTYFGLEKRLYSHITQNPKGAKDIQ